MASEQKTLLVYESFIMCVFLIIGIFKQDFIIVLLGLTVVPSVMFTYYTYLYQSTGTFKTYTRIINISTIINLIVNILLVVCTVQDYRVYVVSYCIVQYASCIAGFLSFKKYGWIDFREKCSFDILTQYITTGILLMIGNFVYTIFLGVDKWFIKFTLDISQFSMYSFAAQMMTIVNMVITPIAMTLYSNMRNRMDKSFEIRIKNILIGILMFIPAAMYVVKFIVENFIDKYNDVIPVMSMLVVMQLFMCMNTALFVNLYKVYKKQTDYFIRLVIAVGIAVILDVIVCVVNPSIEGYAIASLLSCVLWLVENLIYFKHMRFKVKEAVFIGGLLICFSCLFILIDNVVLQIILYLLVYLVALRFLMKEVWDFGFRQIRNLFSKFFV